VFIKCIYVLDHGTQAGAATRRCLTLSDAVAAGEGNSADVYSLGVASGILIVYQEFALRRRRPVMNMFARFHRGAEAGAQTVPAAKRLCRRRRKTLDR
jgi:hypothetical protein